MGPTFPDDTRSLHPQPVLFFFQIFEARNISFHRNTYGLLLGTEIIPPRSKDQRERNNNPTTGYCGIGASLLLFLAKDENFKEYVRIFRY